MDTQPIPLLQANNLSLSYSGSRAVDSLSLTLKRGEVLGLLGLNGAGKSSTLRMLSGITAPSTGDVLIDNISLQLQPRAAKKHIGYLPEVAPLYSDMLVSDYLNYAGRLRGLRSGELHNRRTTILQQLNLESFAQRRIGNLSKGYKQRVGLAQALIHNPSLLILDEPSSGLDPEQMREMRELIRSLRTDKGILFSSHLLSEVTELCDRVLVLHHGKQVYTGTLDQTSQSTGRYMVRFAHAVEGEQITALSVVDEATQTSPDSWAITPAEGLELSVLPALIGLELPVLAFNPERLSVDSVFSSLVGANSAAAVPEQAGANG